MEDVKSVKSMVHAKKSFVLYLTATWCKPCKTFGPIFDDFTCRLTEIGWYKCDVSEDEGIEYAKSLGSRSVPSIIVILDGEVQDVMQANVESLERAYAKVTEHKGSGSDEVSLDGEF